MKTLLLALTAACLCAAQVRIDAGEAEAVLARDWDRVAASEGYIRLKQREASLGRTFTDGDFRRFMDSEELVKRMPALRETLERWKKMDVQAAIARIRPYLPKEARLRATIYPVIKPISNSFVFETTTNPAIFLYVNPDVTPAQFANTVAHELHHIGMASFDRDYEARIARLPENARRAAEWCGAFGEGMAMLAAAGGVDVHPHANGPAKDRERWDRDVANFDADLRTVERFLLDVASGKLDKDDARKRGMEFFGVQGPWYTVGWKMAVAVERRFGRESLIECMLDPRLLLVRYNSAAGGGWSAELLKALGEPDE